MKVLKNLLLIAFVLFASFICSAQMIGNYPIQTKLDSVNYRLDYTRYCMLKFQKQYYAGVTAQVFGLGFGGAMAYFSMSKNNKSLGLYGAAGGGLLALIGTIIQINSHRWFRSAAFGPINYGVGMSLKF